MKMCRSDVRTTAYVAGEIKARRRPIGASVIRPRTIVPTLLVAAHLACGAPESQTRLPGSSTTPGHTVAGGAAATLVEPPPFSDVTADVGLDFVHINGMSGRRYFVEMMGQGGALLDYDGDGDLDLYLVQGRSLIRASQGNRDSADHDRLYRNDLETNPDGSRTLRFADVTGESGIEGNGYGMGVATGDYNNDGWVDLYVINWGSNQLWRNNGNGTFTDVTQESGTDDPRWSTGAAFVDIDLDGWLDLVVVNYNRYTLESDRPCYAESGRRDYCGPTAYPTDQDRLFRNLGDGTFADVTLQMGLSTAYGAALGVIAADFNLDGWTDLYVANDAYENQLWINEGGQRFDNQAVQAGAAVNATGAAEASMGVNAADFDGDGNEDLFLTHLKGETNTLYINLGDALFEDRTRLSGLGPPSRTYTGFGVAPLDYDNDGWLDLFIANGEVRIIPQQADRGEAVPLRQTNQLFRNLGQARFQEVTPRNDEVFGLTEVSRGVAYGDVDNDGDTDILLMNNNGPARLLLNDVGQGKSWLGLRLLGAAGAHGGQGGQGVEGVQGVQGGRGGRDMLGARVAVIRTHEPALWRRVTVDGSYSSAHDPRVLVGLGGETADQVVRAYWPGGAVEVWEGLEINRYHTLVKGQGRAVEAL